MLRASPGEDWRRSIPSGAVLATAVLTSIARVADVNLRTGYAVHDLSTEVGGAVGLGQTRIDSLGRLQPRPLVVVLGRRGGVA